MGMMPTCNTVAEIKGSEKPDEYVMLGPFRFLGRRYWRYRQWYRNLVMMEAMRILKQVYPNPKRTILAGHWGSEEQGLNGSCICEDHPQIVQNIQALFNQDNGTGRVVTIGGSRLPAFLRLHRALAGKSARRIQTGAGNKISGSPAGGGSDNASLWRRAFRHSA